MAGRSVRKLTFKFKLLENIGLGFPVIAVIWGNVYDASDAQMIFYWSECIQQGPLPAKPSSLTSKTGPLYSSGCTCELATATASM